MVICWYLSSKNCCLIGSNQQKWWVNGDFMVISPTKMVILWNFSNKMVEDLEYQQENSDSLEFQQEYCCFVNGICPAKKRGDWMNFWLNFSTTLYIYIYAHFHIYLFICIIYTFHWHVLYTMYITFRFLGPTDRTTAGAMAPAADWRRRTTQGAWMSPGCPWPNGLDGWVVWHGV